MATNHQSKQSKQELEERLIEFASRIISMVESMPKIITAKHIGGQILRSGTSPALNYGEAQAAESPDDFLHKMKVCLKELRETFVSLKIISKQSWFPAVKLTPLLSENNELIAIFTASTRTVSSRIGRSD
jgi:four helix bundle protein